MPRRTRIARRTVLRFTAAPPAGRHRHAADGKSRKLEKPKRKKRRHVQAAFQTESRIAEKIRNGEKVLNSELRKELASLGQKQSQNQGG